MPASDDGDSEDIFLMGPGVAAHRSIFSATAGDGAGNLSGSDGSLGMDDADTLADALKKPRGRGRPPRAQGKGRNGKETARWRAEKRTKKKVESVFIDDDDEVDSDEYEEDGKYSHGDASPAGPGLQNRNDAGDTVIAVVNLDDDEPAAEVRRRATGRTRKRPRHVALSDGSEADAEEDGDAQPQEETAFERRLRESVAAARDAAKEFSEDKVAAEAQAEEQRRHDAEAAAATAAAEEKATQDRLKRAAARDVITGIIHLKVRCLGSSEKPQLVKMRQEHLLGRLKAGICKRFQTQSDRAVLFYQGNVLSERETVAFLGLVSKSELELRISPNDVVKLKVRFEGDVVVPDIRVRQEDPIVCIRHLVGLKTGIPSNAVSLELDGDQLGTETCADLDVDNDTLIEARKVK